MANDWGQRRLNGASGREYPDAGGRGERTAEQVLATTGVDGQLVKAEPAKWGRKVRNMRRDPTVGLIRDLYMAPFFAAEWTVVSDDPLFKDAEDMIRQNVLSQRMNVLKHGVRGLMDFGWQAFEKVYGFDADGSVRLKKLKPLLQDISYLMVDGKGRLAGVRNLPTFLHATNVINGPWVDLGIDEVLVLYRDVEGTNWYGEPLMRRVEGPHDSWEECEESARRFDRKIAGAHWIIHYPVGTTPYGSAMVETDNFEIAQDLLQSLQSSGMIAVPQKVADQIDDLNSLDERNMAWRIELLGAPGSADSSFVGRQRYLDSLKSRGIGIPERSTLEGQFGTRAEAEAHADFALSNIEMGHKELVDLVNEHLVDPLLRINKGEYYEGRVKVKPRPLSDWQRAQLRSLYSDYFRTSEGEAEEADAVDWAAIRDQLEIPTRVERDPETGETVEQQKQNVDVDVASGEFKDLSRTQWKRNVKAIKDVLSEVSSGETPIGIGQQMLQTLGVPESRAESLVRESAPSDEE